MRPPSPVQKEQRQAYQVIACQFGLVVLASIIALMVDVKSAFAVILGGLSALLPQLFFAWRFFRRGGASAIKAILGSFYVGELTKLALTGLLAIVLWKLFKPEPLAFLTGFVLVPFGIFLTPLVVKRK